jgi:methionine synthase II (cobalamin-independent)
MIRSVRKIQAKILHEDLAIQWDVAFEIAMYERLPNPLFRPWFSPLEKNICERILRLLGAIEPNVEVGLHMCYGNLGGKHFTEPSDTKLVADFASSILRGIQSQGQHRISWIHLPVPKNRDDVQYFIPLEKKLISELSEHQTKLFLGLVHPDDEEGTRNRISAAKRVITTDFGISTECGMGRFTKEQLRSVVKICASVAATYK